MIPADPQRMEEALRRIYLKAEQDLVDTITRKRSGGRLDYAEQAALERVQRILADLQDRCWRYVPLLIESNFYAVHPDRARLPESVEKHLRGYANAAALTAEQTAAVETLTSNLMGRVLDASRLAEKNAAYVIGRLNDDPFRRAGIARAAEMEATGGDVWSTANQMAAQLRVEGLTAFVDRAGRKWDLYTYCVMATRTTARQAGNVAVLTKDPGLDLYQMTSHGTACPTCAPYEGRVYSKSGTDPNYPPLSAAFGKVDPAGPDSLLNSYMTIHPNCLHSLVPYSTICLSDEQVRRDREFSSFKTNPPERDPRSEAQIAAYRKQQTGRQKYLRMLRQYQKYRLALGNQVPKTAQTFIKHKLAGDRIYCHWEELYRRL